MNRFTTCSFALMCCFVIWLESRTTAQSEGRGETRAQVTTTATRRPTPLAQASPAPDQPKGVEQRTVLQGIAVELSVRPVSSTNKTAATLREGDYVTVQIKVSYAANGAPVTGSHPAAWMDLQHPGEGADCTTKVKSFLGGSVLTRPRLDLNSYYVLALNGDPTVSVIDPHFGYGGSKLFALVSLKSPGEDWALSADNKTLFVTMPDSNQVAVIDSLAWKVLTNIDVRLRPSRIALQPDGRHVWVGYGSSDSGEDSGVAVIDSERFTIGARIATGKGHHEIALSNDNRFAFVTNSEAGTVSVIDVRSFKKLNDIATGRKPSSIAFSPTAGMAYVADETDGTIAVVDALRSKVVAKIQSGPGLGQIKIAPGGRFGFVPNPAKDLVHIFDTASNRIIQTADIRNGPDQISFSNSLAYVRSQRTEIVTMMQLPKGGVTASQVAVFDFPGGQHALGKTSKTSPADAIVQAPGEDAVLVGNPADKSIYYYKEGMAAPMGTFSNYAREPRAVLVVDRSLRERSPGLYETSARLNRAGLFDVAFLLDTPRIVHCFPVRVEADPDLAALRDFGGVRIEPLGSNPTIRVGESIRLRFKLSDPKTKELKGGLTDVASLIFLAPGIWQKRQLAKEVERGIYEIEFEAPQEGFYYVYLESPSARLTFDNAQKLILEAVPKQ
jgi:YVTN family beta-propeller protein